MKRANEAKEKNENAQSEEIIQVAVMSSIGTDGLVDLNQLKTEIESQNGMVIGTEFPVTVTRKNKLYKINQYGTIEEANDFEKEWIEADSSNTGYDWYEYKENSGKTAQINAPKLADGMKAVKYEAEVDGSKWANAMTKDGSMWVWIPRYAYKIIYKDANNKSNGGVIDIAFLKNTTNEFIDNSIQGEVKTNINDVTYTTNTDGTKSQDQWLLEPAFTLGTENINGFWFAKFEASNTNGYGDNASTANNVDLQLQIKPNNTSWRNITSLNMFTACLNLTSDNKYSIYFNNVSNVDTHMTKNIEWGAVAYLAHSKYGLNGKEISINENSNYKTGYGDDGGSEYNTEVGKKSSTTNNVYGIYDMRGGAYECMAACYKGTTDKLTENSDYIDRYIDVYDGYSFSKYGDAIFETSSCNSESDSWFSGCSYFANSIEAVITRGGAYYDGTSAGLFYFGAGDGNSRYNYGFRPVCVVN